jgi:hypothetical protein
MKTPTKPHRKTSRKLKAENPKSQRVKMACELDETTMSRVKWFAASSGLRPWEVVEMIVVGYFRNP